MKKLLLSAALVAAAALSSHGATAFTVGYTQNINEAYTEINDGDVVQITELETIDEGYVYDLACYLRVKNNGVGPLEATISVANDEEWSSMDGGETILCAFGTCYPNYETPLTGIIPPGGEESGAGFHLARQFGNYIDPVDPASPEYQGSWAADVTIEGAYEKVSFLVIFVNEGAGIEGITADSVAPRYYNLNGVSIAQPVAGQPAIEVRGSKARKILVK